MIQESHNHIPSLAKNVGDVLSAATVLATFTAWLPPIAALLTIIWTALRIWDWCLLRKEKEWRRKNRMRRKNDSKD